MKNLTKIWSVIEKNRWTTILPTIAVILWIVLSVGCTITTTSPFGDKGKVTAAELNLDYQSWLADCELMVKRFEHAATDIEQQQEQRAKITEMLMAVASGNVTNYTGLLSMVTTGGMFGFGVDNVRKGGVIAGLKRNKKPK